MIGAAIAAIALYAVIYAFFLIPLILWLLFFREIRFSFYALIATWAVQYYTAVSVDIGGGDLAYAGGAVFFFIAVINVIAGLVGGFVFPLLALILARPAGWLKYSAIVVGIYATGAAVFILPGQVKGYFFPNMEFHGMVYDRDIAPIPGAIVKISGCKGRSTFKANEDGLVHVKALCSAPTVAKIVRPDTNAHCLSTWHTSADKVASFSTSSREANWKQFTSDNPFVFECIWERPSSTIDTDFNGDSWYRLEADGSKYAFDANGASRKSRLMKGSHVGQIKFSINLIDTETSPVAYSLTLEAINGGIQLADKHSINIAPMDGYTDAITTEVTTPFGKKRIYYRSDDLSTFGYVRVTTSVGWDRPWDYTLDASYHFNTGGGRELNYRLEKK